MTKWACGRLEALLVTGVLLAGSACSGAVSGSPPSGSGTKKTEIWQIDLLPGSNGGGGGGFHPAGPSPPAPHPYPHHPPPSHKGGGRGGGGFHSIDLGSFAGGGLGSVASFEQPLQIHAVMPSHIQSEGTRWPSGSDCAMTSKDMSAIAPFVALAVGLALALPLLGVLFLVKMQLWNQLTGGSTGTPTTVTTSVGGGKEELLARRMDEALPAFRNAISKYVLDGRSVGAAAKRNITARSI